VLLWCFTYLRVYLLTSIAEPAGVTIN